MPTLSPPSSLAELLAEPVNLGETGQRGNLLRRLLWVEGLVDPHGLRQPSGVGGSRTNRSGWAPVGALQHLLAGSEDLFGAAEVHVGGGQQADPGVVVLHVVPVEEALAEGAGILDAAEPVREGGVVLEGLELALRVRVVVGTCGREWERMMPRSASGMATGLAVIELSRSAWMVSVPGSTCWADAM
jgi:hypothetical protein